MSLIIGLQEWRGNEQINIYTCIKEIHVFEWYIGLGYTCLKEIHVFEGYIGYSQMHKFITGIIISLSSF